MTNIVTFENKVKKLLKFSLAQEQIPCPVIHRFGPGIYIREVSMSAGTFAIGHHQKTEHTNILLKGSVTMYKEDNTTEKLEAPMLIIMPPGRKVGFVNEDTVWLNVYSTTETDIEKLEEMFLDKTKSPKGKSKSKKTLFIKENREDFLDVISLLGFTKEQVQQMSQYEEDLIPFPFGSYSVAVLPSPIHGKGLFATADIKSGDIIAPGRIDNKRTPAGRYTNHGVLPNARMDMLPNGDVNLVAIQDIKGSTGGEKGEEVTVDYYHAFTNTRIG